MNTTYGTHHYQSHYHAVKAYGPHEVREALEEGRIEVGKPYVPPGDRLLVDKEGRYHIEVTA